MISTEDKKWVKEQERVFDKFLATDNPSGVFSHEDMKSALLLRDILEAKIEGSCLDVGCGMLKRPSYMCEGVDWYGIDPMDDGRERDFFFRKGIAEEIPFKNSSFDNVLFATSLDHIVDTKKAVSEAYRVLKPGGKIVVWQFVVPKITYEDWQGTGQWANEHHPVIFCHDAILSLFNELEYLVSIAVAENVYIFR